MKYSKTPKSSYPQNSGYNPADYHPPFVPSKRPHTSNSWTIKLWLIAAWIVTPFYTLIWPGVIAETPSHLIPATLLLIGSWVGLVCCAASHLLKNPVLRACRKKYQKDPNGILKGDLMALRITFPLHGLWAITSIALYGWVIYELNPIESATAVYEGYRGEKDLPILHFLICVFQISAIALPFSPLLAGNLLGALPKDPMPEGDPYLPQIHQHSVRTESPWETGRRTPNPPQTHNPMPQSASADLWNRKKRPPGLENLLAISKKIEQSQKNKGKG